MLKGKLAILVNMNHEGFKQKTHVFVLVERINYLERLSGGNLHSYNWPICNVRNFGLKSSDIYLQAPNYEGFSGMHTGWQLARGEMKKGKL